MVTCAHRGVPFSAVACAFLLLSGCRQSAFEQAHGRATAQNPPSVVLRIATVGDVKTFRLPDPVKIEEFFSAKYPRTWYIETADGGNAPTVSDEAYVSDGQTSFMVGGHYGYACCD